MKKILIISGCVGAGLIFLLLITPDFSAIPWNSLRGAYSNTMGILKDANHNLERIANALEKSK